MRRIRSKGTFSICSRSLGHCEACLAVLRQGHNVAVRARKALDPIAAGLCIPRPQRAVFTGVYRHVAWFACATRVFSDLVLHRTNMVMAVTQPRLLTW